MSHKSDPDPVAPAPDSDESAPHATRTTLILATAERVTDERRRAGDRRSPCLVVLSGMRFGELIRLGDAVVLGREKCDVGFPDSGVSRRHARIVHRDGAYHIEDLGSANGTWINGQRLGVPQPLREGDKVHLGPNTLVRFAMHDAIEETFQLRLADAALRDGLTGAYNLRYFARRLASEISFAQRHSRNLSVVVLDVDGQSNLNARIGHAAGDDVLVSLASLLEHSVRTEDVIARIDADAFAVLCRDTTGAQARILADRLRATVAATALCTAAGGVRVTVCAGIACYPEVLTDSPERLLRAADAALFLARRKGPDHTALHAPTRLHA